MVWNWQKVDWPNVCWDVAWFRKAEERFSLNRGEFSGTVKHLADADRAAFEAFGLLLLHRQHSDGIRRSSRTLRPGLQIVRL